MMLRSQGTVLKRVLQARSFTSLPIINVAALVDPQASTKAKDEVASQLHRACRDVGFFYVTQHGMPGEVYKGVLSEARTFFNLPSSVKEEIRLTPSTAFRGYQALGSNVTRYDGGFQRDWHEAIDLYKEVEPHMVQAQGLSASPVHGRNQWPAQVPSFDKALRRYIDECLGLGGAIMRGIALGMGLPESFFEGDRAGDSYWVVRVIHYPPLLQASSASASPSLASSSTSSSQGAAGGAPGGGREDANGGGALREEVQDAVQSGAEVDRAVQLSCGEHTDYGLLTLVNQEQHMAALQVKNAAGQWITAEPVDGAFVCNIGDMLKVWSNGMYTPTLHRVINSDPKRSRVSIPFFYEPNFEAVVAPPQELLVAQQQGALGGGQQQPRFAPVRYGTHLEGKVLSNFEL